MRLTPRELEKTFLQHRHYVIQAVRSLRPEVSGVTADDVEQEVSIRLLKLLNSDREIENISSYIYKITANVIIDLARKNQKYSQDIQVEDGESDENQKHFIEKPNLIPENKWQNHEILTQVLDVIESLPKSRRVAVKLRLQGFSVKEICELTGWSFYKAENLSKRSMAALKNKLKQLGIEYEY